MYVLIIHAQVLDGKKTIASKIYLEVKTSTSLNWVLILNVLFLLLYLPELNYLM